MPKTIFKICICFFNSKGYRHNSLWAQLNNWTYFILQYIIKIQKYWLQIFQSYEKLNYKIKLSATFDLNKAQWLNLNRFLFSHHINVQILGKSCHPRIASTMKLYWHSIEVERPNVQSLFLQTLHFRFHPSLYSRLQFRFRSTFHFVLKDFI